MRTPTHSLTPWPNALSEKQASLAKIIFCYALDGERIIAINLKIGQGFYNQQGTILQNQVSKWLLFNQIIKVYQQIFSNFN